MFDTNGTKLYYEFVYSRLTILIHFSFHYIFFHVNIFYYIPHFTFYKPDVYTALLPGEGDQLVTYYFNQYPVEFIYLNFQPLEIVSRYRDQQTQVVENYSYLFNLKPNKSWCLNTHFIPNISDLVD